MTRLVERAQHGDSAAYDKLVTQFYALAINEAWQCLHDLQLAEDVAQEAFLYAYRALSQLREPAAFPAWFRRIVAGQINRILRKSTMPTTTLDQAAVLADAIAEPSALLVADEETDQLFQAVDALPSHQRDVVALFYISEYSLQVISTFLEIPIATVKTRLYYARQRLKVLLAEEEVTLPNTHKLGAMALAEQALTTKVMRLFRAIIEDDSQTARRLLRVEPGLAHARGLEWSDFWHGEVAAIHLAVMHRRRAMVDLLLAHGAEIDQRETTSNFTVLHYVANMALAGVITPTEGDDLFAFLTARGAVPDIVVYLWRNELAPIRALLAADPTQANVVGVMQATPLCHVTDLPAAQLLLSHGADPFYPLDHVRSGECWPDTPLQWAASRPEHPALFRFLLDYTGTPIDIHLACALGDVAYVQQFLAVDATLIESRTGATHVLLADFTPLHVAARYRQAEVAALLLARGANPDATTATVKDMTPLHLAVMYSAGDEDEVRTEVPQLLLAYGANILLRDSVRELTPLEWAEGSHMCDEKGRADVSALLRAHSTARQNQQTNVS
ncbi:MAG TPA: sigma-70 family RNA polymerase sigma factor [Caldilineaceae bacterium]|nr:sigma-70 family RNA polymerase sigma factor [Caldilineaceae bacterium]